MITLDQILTFGLAAIILIAIPGPSVVFVIGRALAYGRPVALATVLGALLNHRGGAGFETGARAHSSTTVEAPGFRDGRLGALLDHRRSA